VLLPKPAINRQPIGETLLLISAYDEERVIQWKVENSIALEGCGEFPIVVVSDGSTDRTDEIVRQMAARNQRIQLLRVEGRLGKNHALNEALARLQPAAATVVVFSDANAHYEPDALLRLRETLASGATCAVGQLRFVDETTGTARAEGLYWRYENALRVAEGRLGRVSMANGAIFAARAGDVPVFPLDIGNDFWITAILLGKGKAVTYQTDALAQEPAPAASREEFRRKQRMGSQGMWGVIQVWREIDLATRFQLVSHKVLRWLGIPLLAIALSSAVLLGLQQPRYLVAAGILAAPLLLAGVGMLGRLFHLRVPLADLAVHFWLVHLAALAGVVDAIRGKRFLTWEQAASSRRPVA
jgi:glycosyltransferase involved in cell wall biosynthesis